MDKNHSEIPSGDIQEKLLLFGAATFCVGFLGIVIVKTANSLLRKNGQVCTQRSVG